MTTKYGSGPLHVHCDHHNKKTKTCKGYRENVFGLHPSPDTKYFDSLPKKGPGNIGETTNAFFNPK